MESYQTNFEVMFEEMIGSPAPDIDNEQLRRYWGRPVSDLATLPAFEVESGQQERHRIYALMLMAIVHHYWNGNKRGRAGTYPWNEQPDPRLGAHLDGDYLGHNIAAIAVDGEGHVVDFEFNHNRLFNSSAEHAEARLVRRVFGLAQLADAWQVIKTGSEALGQSPKDDYTMLSEVTIYTSLESCSQCAGTMALGRVKEVVYLQTDPGMYFIGRILRNLTSDELRAPLPIAGAQIGLPYFSELDRSFGEFKQRVADEPFWESPDQSKRDTKGSVTSFLCTKLARDIYGRAADDFVRLASRPNELQHESFQPVDRNGSTISSALTNEAALTEANNFLDYAKVSGRRATPHRA